MERANIYWTPQPAYSPDGEPHAFIPQNQPLLCVLDKKCTIHTPQGLQVKERRNHSRIDVWTGKEWLREGEGAGRYHSIYPLPIRTMPCWVENEIPPVEGRYLILCKFCYTQSGSCWRIEPDYYVARIERDESHMYHWKVFRRATVDKFEWAIAPSSSVIAWTPLPQVARPSD